MNARLKGLFHVVFRSKKEKNRFVKLQQQKCQLRKTNHHILGIVFTARLISTESNLSCLRFVFDTKMIAAVASLASDTVSQKTRHIQTIQFNLTSRVN